MTSTSGGNGHAGEPIDILQTGAPAYAGRALDPDVRFDASGLAFIGSPPPARRPTPRQAKRVAVPVQNWALIWPDEPDGRRNGMWAAEGGRECSLGISETGLALEEASHDVKTTKVQQIACNIEAVKINVKRWPMPQEGSEVVISCAFKASADLPRSVLLFELDTRHTSGFSPFHLEHIKAYFLAWQQKYGFPAEIDRTCALAIPPSGVSLAARIPPPPDYDPLDSSTWVGPFPPVSAKQLKLYDDELSLQTEKSTLKRAEETEVDDKGLKGKKRKRSSVSGAGARQASASANARKKTATRQRTKAEDEQDEWTHQEQADFDREQALLAAALEAGEEVYSNTGRQKCKATIKKPTYLLADLATDLTTDSDFEPQQTKPAQPAASVSRVSAKRRRSSTTPAPTSPARSAASAPGPALASAPTAPLHAHILPPISSTPQPAPQPPVVSPEAFSALSQRYDEMYAYLCRLATSHTELLTRLAPLLSEEVKGASGAGGVLSRIEELERRFQELAGPQLNGERQEKQEEETKGGDAPVAEASHASCEGDLSRIAELEAQVAALTATVATLSKEVERLRTERGAA